METFTGAELTPPRISLLSAADIIPMEGERWYTAFDLLVEGCEEHEVYAICPDPDADPKEFADTSGGTIPYAPYVLYATDKCSTFSERNFYDRAQRKLLTGESTALESQLWTGFVAGTDLTATNPYLADNSVTTTITSSVTRAADALSVLEQEMGECSAGRGMIHIRPQALGALLEMNVVRLDGNTYLSPMGNIVVPGRGYPGTGPTGQAVGATEWMFGHPGIVQVRRGPVIRLGEDAQSSQYNWRTNDRQVVVERVVHVALDPTCCVFAIDFASLG